jgi:hypothetical protein
MVEHALDRGHDVVGVRRDQSVGKLDAYRGSRSCRGRRTIRR